MSRATEVVGSLNDDALFSDRCPHCEEIIYMQNGTCTQVACIMKRIRQRTDVWLAAVRKGKRP